MFHAYAKRQHDQNGKHDSAHSALYRFIGADRWDQLVFSKGPSYQIGCHVRYRTKNHCTAQVVQSVIHCPECLERLKQKDNCQIQQQNLHWVFQGAPFLPQHQNNKANERNNVGGFQNP